MTTKCVEDFNLYKNVFKKLVKLDFSTKNIFEVFFCELKENIFETYPPNERALRFKRRI